MGKFSYLFKRSGRFAMVPCTKPSKPAPPAPPIQENPFKVSGRQILFNGSPFYVAGINEGTWGKTESGDSALMKSWGINTVRMPALRWWGNWGADQGDTVDSRDDSYTSGFIPSFLDQTIQEMKWHVAQGLKLWIFIDSNYGQSSLQGANPTEQQEQLDRAKDPKWTYDPLYPPEMFTLAGGGRNFVTDPSQRARFWTVWRAVLTRMIAEDLLRHCVALEIQPEFLADQTDTGTSTYWLDGLKNFYTEGRNVIRQYAPTTPVVMGGQGYDAGGLEDAFMPFTDVIWTADLFMHGDTGAPSVSQWQGKANKMQKLGTDHNVPAITQQTGCETYKDNATHDALQTMIVELSTHDGAILWQLRQNNEDNVSQAFDSYAMIVKHHADNTDIFKTDEINIWKTFWALGTPI